MSAMNNNVKKQSNSSRWGSKIPPPPPPQVGFKYYLFLDPELWSRSRKNLGGSNSLFVRTKNYV